MHYDSRSDNKFWRLMAIRHTIRVLRVQHDDDGGPTAESRSISLLRCENNNNNDNNNNDDYNNIFVV